MATIEASSSSPAKDVVSRFDEQKLLVSRAVGNLEPIPLKPKKELTERGLVSACDVGAL